MCCGRGTHLAISATLILLLCGSAIAGGNADCGVFVDFNGAVTDWYSLRPGSWDNAIYPQAGDTIDVYLGMFQCRGGGEDPPELYLQNVSFSVDLDPASFTLLDWENLLPNPFTLGAPETGAIFVTWGCLTEAIVYFARLSLEYSGQPGDVIIADHPSWPRWVVDCDTELDYYCIGTHGGVGKAPVPGEWGCFSSTPVESTTWGSIKALYRDVN